jgi:predicted metal-dependent hydrolase
VTVRDDLPFPYTVRFSRRAQHLRVVVKPSGIELVVPHTISEARALTFLRRHRDWVQRKVLDLQRRTTSRPPPQRLQSGTTVPFQGREVPLEIKEHGGRRTRVEFDGGFSISVPPGSANQVEDVVKKALFDWIKQWMEAESVHIVRHHAGRFGLEPRQIRIKRMKSRWGSCGPRNDLNLNWLLAFSPPSVFEYVVVHELCHIRYRDHSAHFWNLVGLHLPHYAKERQWLRRNGVELLRRFE